MLTTAEVATELNCSVRRVQDLIKTGRLVTTRFGRQHQIDPQDLDAVRTRPNGRPRKVAALSNI